MKKPIKKQFIAGATCPQCGQTDTIVQMLHEDQTKHIACVQCDYQESHNVKPNDTSKGGYHNQISIKVLPND